MSDAYSQFDAQAEPLPELLKNASTWMIEPAKEPDPIITDFFDRGDKVVIIGVSKSRKSFFDLHSMFKFLKYYEGEKR